MPLLAQMNAVLQKKAFRSKGRRFLQVGQPDSLHVDQGYWLTLTNHALVDIPYELIVLLVTLVVGNVGVVGETAFEGRMVGIEKAMPHTGGNGAVDDFLDVGDKALVTDSSKNKVIGPIIAVIHAELNHNEIRTMRGNVVVHALKSLPGRVAVYTGVLNYEGGAVLLDFGKLDSQVEGPRFVGIDKLTETNRVTKQVKFNRGLIHVK